MKRKLLYIAILVMVGFSAKSQVFFNQNFNGASLGSITGTGANQFDGIEAIYNTPTPPAVAQTSVSITNDKLVLSRLSSAVTGERAYFVRTTPLAPATQFIKVKMKLVLSSTQTTTATSTANFAFGQDFGNDAYVEGGDATNPNDRTGNVWERISINFETGNSPNGRFRLRDGTGSTNIAPVPSSGISTANGSPYNRSEEHEITFYINATDEPQAYTGPDNVAYTLPGQRWNAFVGTVKQFTEQDRVPLNTAVTINNFKFLATGGVTAIWTIDDLTMEALTVVLPVSLTSFTGKWENSAAQLKWQTASEQNNSHFEILRSTDGINFIKIGTKEGEGTTSGISNYTYTDYTATAGDNYYKLRQVDFDGKSKEYDAVVVKNPLQAQSLTAKITASGNLEVSVNAASAKLATLTVTDVQGKKVAVHNANLQQGNNVLSVSFGHVASGVYIINIDGGKAQKFIKK